MLSSILGSGLMDQVHVDNYVKAHTLTLYYTISKTVKNAFNNMVHMIMHQMSFTIHKYKERGLSTLIFQ